MELLLAVRREEVLDNDEAEEEDAEIGGDIEEGEVQDLDAGSEDDNVQEGGDEQSEDEIEVDQPEGTIEDNSNEPSTGAQQVGRGLGMGSSSIAVPVGQGGFEQDQGETDSVVPTTPKLPLPRRNDGFAEAVSSPQVGDS